MRALVVYESMFGNTHQVAEAIADGLRPDYEVSVVSAHDATAELSGIDLLVVGGPTHVHGMSSPRTRAGAPAAAAKAGDLALEPNALGDGVREWFERLADQVGGHGAAFDTRLGTTSAVVTGRASKGIAKRMRRHGIDVFVDPESFLVDGETHLLAGELERAHGWGRKLAGHAHRRPR
jgi:hypothetical protein